MAIKPGDDGGVWALLGVIGFALVIALAVMGGDGSAQWHHMGCEARPWLNVVPPC